MEKILKEQDYLYTLIVKNPKGENDVRVIASLLGYMNAATNKLPAIARLADEKTSLVTLTVTESGYFYDKEKSKPNSNEADVKWDLENPDNPKTAAGFLAAGLKRRFIENRKPLTIMCCDNVPHNGKVLESSVLFYCEEHCKEIIPWIRDNVSFPSSMVDRITPGTTPLMIRELEENYFIQDNWPVCAEDFIQWVLEDNFKTAVPDYGAAGVQIVKDVEPYELMKIRLLNGSHSAMAYPCYLLGCRFVDEGMIHPLINNFIRNHYMEEVTPTLEPVPGIDINVYKDTLVSRFSNKNISDTILRLTSRSTGKVPGFQFIPLSDAVRKGFSHNAMCFSIAAWARFLNGKDEQGKDIPLDDPNYQQISREALNAQNDPKAFLIKAGLKNLSEAQIISVAETFKKHLVSIYQKGIKTALEEFLRK
jgi:mannitol 2-dehydrogenase